MYNVSTYCPLCNTEHSISIARKHINYRDNNKKGASLSNKKKTKCLHCDIFIPGLSVGSKYNSVGIEYDGTQHFQPVDFKESFQRILNHHKFFEAGKLYMKLYNILLHNQKRDNNKEEYCKKHHIYLIRIEHYRLNNQNYRYVKNLVTRTLNKKLLPIILHDIYE